MRQFVICIHDATPAFARETRALVRDLAPLVGRRLCFGVVPHWHGAWPLAHHRGYAELIRDSSDELLLHGYHHRRRHGRGAVSWIADGSDEMNGLNAAETLAALQRGQHVFSELYGAPARGFLPPAWQRGHVRAGMADTEYLLGFFSLDTRAGACIPLATWTWDCGRWSWLGHAGHAIGSLLHHDVRRVPVLAIHPRDAERGFRSHVLELARALLDRGYQPCTAAQLLEANDVEAAV